MTYPHWSSSEDDILRRFYTAITSVLQNLPKRNWHGIKRHASILKVKRDPHVPHIRTGKSRLAIAQRFGRRGCKGDGRMVSSRQRWANIRLIYWAWSLVSG
jgi:hypothetical protein